MLRWVLISCENEFPYLGYLVSFGRMSRICEASHRTIECSPIPCPSRPTSPRFEDSVPPCEVSAPLRNSSVPKVSSLNDRLVPSSSCSEVPSLNRNTSAVQSDLPSTTSPPSLLPTHTFSLPYLRQSSWLKCPGSSNRSITTPVPTTFIEHAGLIAYIAWETQSKRPLRLAEPRPRHPCTFLLMTPPSPIVHRLPVQITSHPSTDGARTCR
jgi:hypothetical protein